MAGGQNAADNWAGLDHDTWGLYGVPAGVDQAYGRGYGRGDESGRIRGVLSASESFCRC